MPKGLGKKYVCLSLHRKRRAYFNCPPRRLGTVEGIGKLLSCLARNWFTNRVWAMHATVAQAGRGEMGGMWIVADWLLDPRQLFWRRVICVDDADDEEDDDDATWTWTKMFFCLTYSPSPSLSSLRTSSFYFLASKLKRQRSKLIKAKQVPSPPLPFSLCLGKSQTPQLQFGCGRKWTILTLSLF